MSNEYDLTKNQIDLITAYESLSDKDKKEVIDYLRNLSRQKESAPVLLAKNYYKVQAAH